MSRRQSARRSVVQDMANAHNDADTLGAEEEENNELREYEKLWVEKGNVSLWLTAFVTFIGCIVVFDGNSPTAGQYILSVGLFGFAGGITNWLAVTMLFQRVPGLYGSGVIPVRYVQIRETVKDVIMATFFDPAFLEMYLGTKLEQMGGDLDTDQVVSDMVESDEFDRRLDEKLADIGKSEAFAPVLAMGMDAGQLKPMVKPFVADLGQDLAPYLKSQLTDPKRVVEIEEVRNQIDTYMSVRMETLTERKVTRLLEFVIRGHLGWLIVWGNVFGSIIGLISEVLQLTPRYRD